MFSFSIIVPAKSFELTLNSNSLLYTCTGRIRRGGEQVSTAVIVML